MPHTNKKIYRHLFLIIFTFISITFQVFANDTTLGSDSLGTIPVVSELESHGNPEKLNPGKLILDHIYDSHEWHIMTIGEHHVTVPLPVIIYDQGNLIVFSSSHFHHGHESYMGYKIENNKIVKLNEDKTINKDAKLYDISITKNVSSLFLAVFIIFVLFFTIAAKYKKNALRAPSGIQSLIEPLIIFIRDEIAKPSIGAKYASYLPFLLTLFFFIFINNLLGLVPFFPGGANVTGNIAVTMVMALFTFTISVFSAKKAYWKHLVLPPGVPLWLLPLMIPIELIGFFNKPIVLMIRLFANITAGHIIILGFLSLIFIFGEMNVALGWGVSIFSIAFSVFMSFLELLVAFLQAYVFTLLSALYFGMALEDSHEESH